jgi:hypothetical protein
VGDWLGFADEFDELLANFESFLAVCLEFNITYVEHFQNAFPGPVFGFQVDQFGTRLADKHLCPINKELYFLGGYLGAPQSARSLCCLAQVSQGLSGHYETTDRKFEGKTARLSVGRAATASLRADSRRPVIGPSPRHFRFSLYFHLQTDASEDGKADNFYQLANCPIDDQFSYCKEEKHSPDNMSITAHYSKAWTEALPLRPPFYLEADALLWGTNEVTFYTLSSTFPQYTYSDYLPSNWMKKSEKGPVYKFLVEFSSSLGFPDSRDQSCLSRPLERALPSPLT